MAGEIAHASFGASNSKRRMACPGSLKAEERFPDESSSFAELGTAAHELGHLLFDVPAALATGTRHYRAIAAGADVFDRSPRGAEGRANEFMGAFLTPPIALHTRLLAMARSEGLRLARAPHQGRPCAPVLAAGNPPDAGAGILAALAAEFGVSERFVTVRVSLYGLIKGGR